ncbi:MAG: c-type cytochrome [Acidobacteria bacterium]|nr:c-type cytochrome [Acidobacteriota bacterium]
MRVFRGAVPAFVTLVAVYLMVGCTEQPTEVKAPAPEPLDASVREMFDPLPASVPGAAGEPSADMITLGRMLFYEPRLSKSQKISCNTCHDLAKYGVDGEPTSDGHRGQKGDRNSPTVYNAAAHFAQFWDGRAADVEEQAKGPVLNPVEMAMPAEPVVVAVLTSMPEYVDLFRSAFPGEADPVTYDNMARAIGAFERRLMTPGRWDALLNGDASALTAEERLGLQTFLDAGCQACHAGALLGGTSYQQLGTAKPFPGLTDPGRFKVTHDEADKAVFKVPSLRNVEKTGPYFHDGKVGPLADAVGAMAEHQLGESLTAEQTARIVDFLSVLTGKIDPEYIKPPQLPPSTATTPKPEE